MSTEVRAQHYTFVARLPVLDRRLRVQGYELRYRNGLAGAGATLTAATTAARVVASSALTLPLSRVAGNQPVLVAFPASLLVEGFPSLFPPARLVVLIDHRVPPDSQVLAACGKLARLGYRLALEDLADPEARQAFLSLADMAKIDVTRRDPGERRVLTRLCERQRAAVLATGVDTVTAFDDALAFGATYFQGDFLARPTLLAGRDIPIAASAHTEVLGALARRPLDLTELGGLLKHDVALADKFLRYLNSAAFGWRSSITSLHHALVLLGDSQVRKWASLIVLTELAARRPPELVTMSLIRAHLCESLGKAAGIDDAELELFLVGMYSLIDAILGMPLEQALETLPLSDAGKEALRGQENAFRAVLDAAIASERGAWERLESVAADLGLTEGQLSISYQRALEFAGSLDGP